MTDAPTRDRVTLTVGWRERLTDVDLETVGAARDRDTLRLGERVTDADLETVGGGRDRVTLKLGERDWLGDLDGVGSAGTLLQKRKLGRSGYRGANTRS